MSVPMLSRPLAYVLGPYASQGFHIPLSLVPIPSPNFNFLGNPVHVVRALGSADGENANTIVLNMVGRPGPASRPANSGRGTDRPSGSLPIVGSDLPTPTEYPETPGGNTDPALTQPGLNTSEEDIEEETGSGRARWGSLEV
ncbi:hypothetical protein R1flu_004102 [Riccia fluitans]|uniref:Uncharacterized protein n=1 Tax=Riccia fluitans TaxID=41844 RepID=A0ABD1YPL6_9MARC